MLPVPAPATAWLLRGAPIYSADVDLSLIHISRSALTEQLTAQIADQTLTGSTYPALGVERDAVFLGYSEYKLSVHSVQLMLSTGASNPLLTMNDTARTGEVVSGGVLYKDLFPGRYTCLVTASSSTGETVTGTATELDLFQTSEPTVFNGALPLSDITVSGCTSDEATILVNDQAIACLLYTSRRYISPAESRGWPLWLWPALPPRPMNTPACCTVPSG